MLFPTPLVPATFISRQKRFITQAILANGETVFAHCPNTGSMKSCFEDNGQIFLSKSNNPNRKYIYTWELSSVEKNLVGINTQLPNFIVHEALLAGKISEVSALPMDPLSIRREVKLKDSRLDFCVESNKKNYWIEVKNTTLRVGDHGHFPDAPSERALKHLHCLEELVKNGDQAIILFLVNRGDVNAVTPADAIHPEYGEKLRDVVKKGVIACAYQVFISVDQIYIDKSLPVIL